MNKIVTAADTSHGISLAKFVKTWGQHFPGWQIDVWDLGLTSEDRQAVMESNPNVCLKFYDYGRFPEWHNVRHKAGEYGWKAICCAESWDEYTDRLIWADTTLIPEKQLKDEIEAADRDGVYAGFTQGRVSEYTDPRVLEFWGVSCEEAYQYRMRAASLIIFTRKGRKILDSWAEASLFREAWAYEDSLKHPLVKGEKAAEHNHRQDQSVLNILLIKHGLHRKMYGKRPNWRNVRNMDKKREKNV